MITEDYVSFETAKLLKEKGFDGSCFTYYSIEGNAFIFTTGGVAETINNTDLPIYSPNIIKAECVRPTLQMAVKWFREKYQLHIEVKYGNVGDPKKPKMQYWYEIINNNGQFCEGNITEGNTSYKEACEAAIKYCLENLVNKKEANH